MLVFRTILCTYFMDAPKPGLDGYFLLCKLAIFKTIIRRRTQPNLLPRSNTKPLSYLKFQLTLKSIRFRCNWKLDIQRRIFKISFVHFKCCQLGYMHVSQKQSVLSLVMHVSQEQSAQEKFGTYVHLISHWFLFIQFTINHWFLYKKDLTRSI